MHGFGIYEKGIFAPSFCRRGLDAHESNGFVGRDARQAAGTDLFTFDERNRLITSPDGTHAYDARGTLESVTSPTGQVTTYTFDAAGRLSAFNDTVSYTYDALDRIATRDSSAFTYSGSSLDPVSDGTDLISRSPGGRILGVANGTDAYRAGTNRHGDLTYLIGASGQPVMGRSYDPFGVVTEAFGTVDPSVGFQSDFTDPSSGLVWTGARWYSPQWASFISRDTVGGELRTPVGLNRYTYGFASPMTYWDPDGHWPKWADNLVDSAKDYGRNVVSSARRSTKAVTSAVSSYTSRTYSAMSAGIQNTRGQFRDGVTRVRAAARRAETAVFGAPIGTFAGEFFSQGTLQLAGRSTVNTARALTNGITNTVTFGHGTSYGPVSDEPGMGLGFGIANFAGSMVPAVLLAGLPALEMGYDVVDTGIALATGQTVNGTIGLIAIILPGVNAASIDASTDAARATANAMDGAADVNRTTANLAQATPSSSYATNTAGQVPTVQFSRTRAPGIAQNFDDAVANGAPTQLNRVSAATRDANKRAALRGQSPAPAGQSLDEYPFACTAQGGCGSFVRSVPAAEQSYQGGVLSRFFQNNGVGVGDPFNVVIGP
jgi:RHS repeat-associated protein